MTEFSLRDRGAGERLKLVTCGAGGGPRFGNPRAHVNSRQESLNQNEEKL